MPKARFKTNNIGLSGLELCGEYPKCNCTGHYIYEKNKKKDCGEFRSEDIEGCGKNLCTQKGCMWCVCGGTDNKGKLMLCEKCSSKHKEKKK